jgi:hypothetical protein
MNQREAKACYTALLGNARASEKAKIKLFLDAFIDGQTIQMRRDDDTWVDITEPSFTPDSLKRMRVKPGPAPFGPAAIHKLNGRTVRHNITGEVRYVFVGADHQPVFFRKVEKTSAAELLRNWVMAGDGTDAGSILGALPTDKPPRKEKKEVLGMEAPEIPPTVTEPVVSGGRSETIPLLGAHTVPASQRVDSTAT